MLSYNEIDELFRKIDRLTKQNEHLTKYNNELWECLERYTTQDVCTDVHYKPKPGCGFCDSHLHRTAVALLNKANGESK